YTSAQTVTWAGSGTLVAGDFDGDGKADVGFYSRTTGRWRIAKSSTGYTSAIDITFGGGGQTAAPGDYDGDGMLDLATFRAGTGTWSILTSSSGYASSMTVNGLGSTGDVAVSGAIALGGVDDTIR